MSTLVAYIFRTDSDVDYLGLDSLAVHINCLKTSINWLTIITLVHLHATSHDSRHYARLYQRHKP